jgi:hypothetical protein
MELSRMTRRLAVTVLVAIPLVSLLINVAGAVPIFSRKYQTSCSTCHYAFPQLNAFGKAFLNNGWRYPGGDANARKEEPVSLGSEAYKQVWPNAIWPSDVPGTSPFAVHATGSVEMPFNQPDSVAKSRLNFPEHVQVFYAGTLGETFSFFGEVELEKNDAGGIDVGCPFRLQWNRAPGFNVVVGSLHFDPSPGDFSLIPSDINVGVLPSRNGWTAAGEMPGLGVWGAGNGPGGKGGWKYMGGMVQGQGMSDIGADKDFFARGTYKFGGLGEIGGTAGQASASSAFYRDNSATVGAYVYTGKVAGDGVGTFYADRENLTAVAGTADIWYERAILNATVMSMTSKIPDRAGVADRKSLAWYAQGQYVIYPWLIGLARFESTTLDKDSGDKAETTLIPAVVTMVRANVKLTLEYRRPITHYDVRKVDEEHLFLRVNFAL